MAVVYVDIDKKPQAEEIARENGARIQWGPETVRNRQIGSIIFSNARLSYRQLEACLNIGYRLAQLQELKQLDK